MRDHSQQNVAGTKLCTNLAWCQISSWSEKRTPGSLNPYLQNQRWMSTLTTSHNLNYDAYFSIWKSGGKYSGTKISSLEGFPVLEVSSTQSVANNKVVLWTFRLWLIWVNRWQTKKLMKWWRKLIATRMGKSALKVNIMILYDVNLHLFCLAA